MMQLILITLPFLIVDIINPVLLGGTIYTLNSKNSFENCLLMLGSFFLTYFLAGLIIVLGLESFQDYFRLPAYFDYILELLVAALLFYMAFKQYREGDTHPEKDLPHENGMTAQDALRLGIVINIVGLPFAVPYLAAIDQILKTDDNFSFMLLVLLIYNFLYILPFSSLILIQLLRGKKSSSTFRKINAAMHRLIARWLPWILLLLGLILVEDAVSYLLGYREYSLLEIL